MQDQTFLVGAVAVMSLLTFATLVFHLAKLLRIPFPVGLLVSGFGLGFVFAHFFPVALNAVEFSPEIVFFIFLPTLIFESAYHLNLRTFRHILPEVVTLSFLGLGISVVVITAGLHLLLAMPLGPAFLFAALISATDPVAILAIFREMRVPKNLETLVDGESLLNDGTALVLFQFLYKIFILGGIFTFSTAHVSAEIGHLLLSIAIGLCIGAVSGFCFAQIISHAKSRVIQLTLSVILAHVTFILAEGFFHASGILATLMAGIIMGNYGKRKLKKSARSSFKEIWGFMTFVSNALIFLLLGIKLSQMNFFAHWDSILLGGVLCILVARPLSVLLSLNTTNLFRAEGQKIPLKTQGIITWGGIRGALAATAVLLIPETYAYAEQLQAMTAGVILMTFVGNALSLKMLLRAFKFDKYTHNEQLQNLEARIIMTDKVQRYLRDLKRHKYISPKVHNELVGQYQDNKQKYRKDLKAFIKDHPDYQREITKVFTHYALNIELQAYQNLYDYDEIDDYWFGILRSSINRQLERLVRDELPEERKVLPHIAPKIPKESRFCSHPNRWLRKVCRFGYLWRRNRKILNRWIHYRARRIASWEVQQYFEGLKTEHDDVKNIKAVKRIIHRYDKWHQNALQKMKELQNEFPEVLDDVRHNMAQQLCLQKEHEIEHDFWQTGLINQKIYDDLEDQNSKRGRKCGKMN